MTTSLLLDLILDIAACSDPATLVRCAATCKDLRRHTADPAFRRRLRLRHCDRFVPSLLRGHLVANYLVDNGNLHFVDTTSPYSTRVLRADACFPPGPDGEPLMRQGELLASRDGLLLVRTAGLPCHELRICCPATGRSQALPPLTSEFDGQYVLLVGDGEKASLAGLSKCSRRAMCCQIASPLCTSRFSLRARVLGATTLRSRLLASMEAGRGASPSPWLLGTLSTGCASPTQRAILTLHVGAAPQVTSTKLPASFHAASSEARLDHMILAFQHSVKACEPCSFCWRCHNCYEGFYSRSRGTTNYNISKFGMT
ncbi:hypothetical protein BAE44_0012631 [Dichanthelium oligosanthes]|uniref:F-box domain-containing protein n=1 Tax=Dichanthelium oligosanthes TaxID=888268 RepID=A0A1E5VMJ3_9POAL|nr:hypothetical protein BAE44_0012631 [Dichanthelium oligosanthes]